MLPTRVRKAVSFVLSALFIASLPALVAPSASAAMTVPQMVAPKAVAQPATSHPVSVRSPDKKISFGGYYAYHVHSYIYGNEGYLCLDFSEPSSGNFGSWAGAQGTGLSGTYYLHGKNLHAFGDLSSQSDTFYYDLQGELKDGDVKGGFSFAEYANIEDAGTFELVPTSSGCSSSFVRERYRGEALSP